MKVLDDNYGQIKSTISNLSLLSKLSDNKKLITETMNDYFARTERIIHDIQSLDDSTMSSTQKKFYFLRGLEHDPDWHTITTIVAVNDSDNKWSVEKLKQFLVAQDDEKTVVKLKNEKDTNNNSNNNQAHSSSSHQPYRGRGRGRKFFSLLKSQQ
jgi:hypothetical protein